MTPRRDALVFAFLALLAPLALAQDAALPSGAEGVTTGGVSVQTWIGTADQREDDVEAGTAADIWFAVRTENLSENATARVVYVNFTGATPADLVPNGTGLVFRLNATANWSRQFVHVTVPATATGAVDWFARFEAMDEVGNGTLTVASGQLTGGVAIRAPIVEEPGLPTSYLVAGAAALVVGGGAAVYGLRRRAERKRIERAPRRSQALREQQMETRLERAQEKQRVEEVQQIQQEIRQEQVVREKRRELQILEAKRADALKTLELLRKRHEAGGLSKLQYDNMAAKKQGDLDRIEAEIAQMEREDAGAAA